MARTNDNKPQPVHFGPWQILIAYKHVLCSDGIRRRVRITAQPDTYFSIPGSVKVRGVTVSGFVSSDSDGEVHFTAYTYGKNGHMLP